MISVIIGAIVEVGKWLADKAVTIAVVIYHATRIVGLALFRFGKAVAGVFGKAWDLLSAFYANVLKPFVQWSWKIIVKLHDWLKGVFAPLLKFLQAVRDDILKIYDKWLKPIFDTIDALRQTLRALELFHVPFAKKLDDALASLEARLLQPIRLALTTINELVNWINRIVDFNGLFQRLTLIESAWHYSGDVWNVLLKHRPDGVSLEENADLHRLPYPSTDPRRLATGLREFYRTDAGELAPAIDALVPVWRSSASQ